MAVNKIECTEKDLEDVVNMFRSSMEVELDSAKVTNIDVNKATNDFENLLRQTVTIVPSFEDDLKAQQVKNEIESMQRKAIRYKNNIHNNRNLYLENVRNQIEQSLKDQRPVIEPIPDDEEVELPQEFLNQYNILENAINTLSGQLENGKRLLLNTFQKNLQFYKVANDFMESSQ